MLDPGETCDGNCPTSCDDANACTTDQLTGSAAQCTALVLDAAGAPRVVFFNADSSTTGLEYGGRSQGVWRAGGVDPSDDGMVGSIAVDAAQGIHLSYRGLWSKTLKYQKLAVAGAVIEAVDAAGGLLGSNPPNSTGARPR